MSIEAAFAIQVGRLTLEAELQVGDDELLAVVGPNGAGKTTLLRVLAGLTPVDRGRVSIDGTTVDEPAKRCFVAPEHRSVGVVFQDYLLFPHLDVRDNVAFGLRERGADRRSARRRAGELLERAGLQHKARARPSELSGGEAQRVALARAVAFEPAVLLLDEPLAALDVRTRADTRRHLGRALDGMRGSRVLVTHDPIDAFTLADRVLILEQGLVTQVGTVAEVVSRPRSEYVGDLVGVNYYRGTARAGIVAVGDQAIITASPLDGDVVVTISPSAVVVHRQPPAGSARNTFAGTVAAVEHLAQRVRVRIEGDLSIVAEVTPAAVDDLGLAEGTAVWAAVKATEVQLHT